MLVTAANLVLCYGPKQQIWLCAKDHGMDEAVL